LNRRAAGCGALVRLAHWLSFIFRGAPWVTRFQVANPCCRKKRPVRTSWPRHFIGGSIAASWLLTAAIASAEIYPGGIRLAYSRGPGTASCLDEASFRDLVATHLRGIDPFKPDGAWRMAVAISRRNGRFVGEVTLYDGDGERRGEDELTATSCGRLMNDVGLTLGVAVLPLVWKRAPPPQQPPVTPLEPPRATPRPPPRTAREPARPLRRPASTPPSPAAVPASPRLQLGAGPQVAGGLGPTWAFGASGSLGLRWPSMSVLLEARLDFTLLAQADTDTTLEKSWLGASLATCAHKGWVFGCGLAMAGQVRDAVLAAGTPITSPKQAGAYAGLGIRGGVEVPFSSRFAGQVSADLQVHMVRPQLWYNGRQGAFAGTTSETLTLRLVTFF
jgi:hypothetical protein